MHVFRGRILNCFLRVALPAGWLVGNTGGALVVADELEPFTAIPLQVTSKHEGAGFHRLPVSLTSITFTNRLTTHRHTTNQIFLNGSGVAAGDVDGDGWCDLYFAGIDSDNRLYRNLGGWKFEDITESAGVAGHGLGCSGVLLADLEGDGDLDLILNTVGQGTHLFLNDGRGRFHEPERHGVLNPDRGAMTSAMGDIDGDGDLDLYISNYRRETIRDQLSARFEGEMVDGKPVITRVNGVPISDPEYHGRFTLTANGKVLEHGEIDAFYRNDGEGGFTAIPFTEGTFLDADGRPLAAPPREWGLTVMLRDFNGDRAPDIYVCNDYGGPDRFWINSGGGQFYPAPPETQRTMCMFAMGLDVADIDRDGRDDFFVADMLPRTHAGRQVQMNESFPVGTPPQYSRNTLFLQREDGTYAEIGAFSGVHASDWTWSPVFLDVDLDGYEDILLATGHEVYGLHADASRKIESMRQERRMSVLDQLRLNRFFPRLNIPNLIFRNRGDLTFEDYGERWGFRQPTVSHSLALADLDNDGDLDVAFNNMNDVAGIYRNDCPAPRLAVQLAGSPPNTFGIGARIRVLDGPVTQSQEMLAGGHYLSGDQPMRSFAAGSPTNRLRIEVTWPDGKMTRVEEARPNHRYIVRESGAVDPPAEEALPSPEPWFTDVSAALGHEHHDDPFDDFSRQPLLPRKLSPSGPGVTWFDVNEDGLVDLFVSGGRGGRLAVFLNRGQGRFLPVKHPELVVPNPHNQTTILGLGRDLVLMGVSQYADPEKGGAAVQLFNLGKRAPPFDLIPSGEAAVGPLAMTDYDGDGDVDLFVGGRVIPGRYPKPASSRLYLQDKGRLIPDTENNQALRKLGIVHAAVWTDLTGDGFPELVVACDWGPVRVFENRFGHLEEMTAALGLDRYHGWWNSVAAGDFDGDGRLDLVAGNWGQNNFYHHEGDSGLRMYYGDFTGDGTTSTIEAITESPANRIFPVRNMHCVVPVLPFIQARVRTYADYAACEVPELLGSFASKAEVLRIDTLASMAFLNRGDHLEAVELPREAQWAPVFGVVVSDFDGDGCEDLFLAQNFSHPYEEMPPFNSGRGLCLRGDGHGGFTSLTGSTSGIRIYGDQRGAAAGDFDNDGRVDLVVGQNRSTTRLFHNRGARPGLRLRLQAGPPNPRGIGAVVRLESKSGWGPAREVRAGSGYWSEDDAVQVMSSADPALRVRVRWPGGKLTTSDVPEGAREIFVDHSGRVTTIQ